MLSFFGWGSKSPSSPSQPSNDPPQIQQQQQQQQQQPEPTPTTPTTPQINRNLKLFYGGLAFLSLSIFLTRRSFKSRLLSSIPPYYTSSIYHKPPISGATDAVDALALATINVFSFSMAFSGGVLYALDINSLEDMRRIARRSYAGDGNASGRGQSDEELEEEIEAWVVSILGRKGEREMQRVKEEKEREAGTGK